VKEEKTNNISKERNKECQVHVTGITGNTEFLS